VQWWISMKLLQLQLPLPFGFAYCATAFYFHSCWCWMMALVLALAMAMAALHVLHNADVKVQHCCWWNYCCEMQVVLLNELFGAAADASCYIDIGPMPFAAVPLSRKAVALFHMLQHWHLSWICTGVSVLHFCSASKKSVWGHCCKVVQDSFGWLFIGMVQQWLVSRSFPDAGKKLSRCSLEACDKLGIRWCRAVLIGYCIGMVAAVVGVWKLSGCSLEAFWMQSRSWWQWIWHEMQWNPHVHQWWQHWCKVT